jgi:hypothetical protein
MTNIFEILTSSKDITNGTQFEAINKAHRNEFEAQKKTFAHVLTLCQLYGKASEYLSSKQGKAERMRLNVKGDKYDIFEALFGRKKTQTSLYITASKISPDILEQFKNSNIPHTLENFVKFAKAENETSEGEINTTREGITERNETEKPAKYTTAKKGIDIKVNSGFTADDIADAIAYLQSLQVK